MSNQASDLTAREWSGDAINSDAGEILHAYEQACDDAWELSDAVSAMCEAVAATWRWVYDLAARHDVAGDDVERLGVRIASLRVKLANVRAHVDGIRHDCDALTGMMTRASPNSNVKGWSLGQAIATNSMSIE
jgi:hypothetical protein